MLVAAYDHDVACWSGWLEFNHIILLLPHNSSATM